MIVHDRTRIVPFGSGGSAYCVSYFGVQGRAPQSDCRWAGVGEARALGYNEGYGCEKKKESNIGQLPKKFHLYSACAFEDATCQLIHSKVVSNSQTLSINLPHFCMFIILSKVTNT